MGVTKSEIFSTKQNEIATFAKVLGHPARIAILQHLQKENTCICGDIVDVVGLAQPTISQHLKELKNVGIIQGNISGTSVCYCINPEKWKKINAIFSVFFSEIKNACCS